MMFDADRLTKPGAPTPAKKLGDDSGPSKPDVRKPEGGNELLKRMKKVDPDQDRQRSGE
jgi:hypothetical protein